MKNRKVFNGLSLQSTNRYFRRLQNREYLNKAVVKRALFRELYISVVFPWNELEEAQSTANFSNENNRPLKTPLNFNKVSFHVLHDWIYARRHMKHCFKCFTALGLFLMISPNYFLDDYKSAKVQFFLTHQKVKYNVSVTYIVG